MINHNKLLYQILDRKLNVVFNNNQYTSNYTEGDIFELVAKLNDSAAKYPIIWLQTGYTVERRKTEEKTKLIGCRFFIITLGSKTDRYIKRFESTYDNILYPLLNSMDKTFNKTRGITASDIDTYTVFPLNDLAKDEEGKNIPQLTAIAEVWDAVLFETDITISNSCFPELKIK